MTPTASGMFEFGVLGPIVAFRGGQPLPLGGPRQRRLLALLLIEPGRAVPIGHLIDELWQGDPPASAETSLRASVSKLRTALGTDALTRSPAGYTLGVPTDSVDAVRFEVLVREGRNALSGGRMRDAAEAMASVLALWRGEPFDGATGAALGLEAERLAEIRLGALEGRFEAELELGGAGELVEELEALVGKHPYREQAWRQLMLALYRSGRQADALAAYARARSRLHDDLGLEPSEELRRLEQDILKQEVSPARLADDMRRELPTPLTTFVGRDDELAELGDLLVEARLVTLTGVGGTGKTRLAIEAATRLPRDVTSRVVFVDLAPLTDPALVASQVAEALDIREGVRTSIVDQLVGGLRDAECLLVLDNCEHVRDACAELAHALLSGCPAVRILATSRESLGVAGEIDYSVSPLGVAPEGAGVDELRASDAVRLFFARAREARPRLEESDAALIVAGRIARDLDGLPLALELAAARAKALSVEEIATGLADRFRFLVSWRRLTAARHRTLREAIDWSFDLLDDDERRFLAFLSVFSGGFSRKAAAETCLDGDDDYALRMLDRLVNASLVVADEHRATMRYRLLETVRQYGAARLDEAGLTSATRDRHAAHFTEFVELAWCQQRYVDLDGYVRYVEPEVENLRAALAWSRDSGDAGQSLRLARGTWLLWWVRGRVGEGRRWLESALALEAEVDQLLRAEALEGAAGLAWTQGDLDSAERLADEALPLFVAAGDPRGEYGVLTILGHVAYGRERLDLAEQLFDRTTQAAERIENDDLRRQNIALTHHNLGSVAFARGDLDRASERYEATAELYEAMGDHGGVALSKLFLSLVDLEAGRVAAAAKLLQGAFRFYREMGFDHYTLVGLEGAAAVAHQRGRLPDGTRILAGAAAMRERLGEIVGGVPRARREQILLATRERLGEAAFERLWNEGRSLPEHALLDLAERVLAD
jgi:predicted ATPase/DNA-binding SARP family transcriptional activator